MPWIDVDKRQVEMIVDKSGLVQAFRAEATMEAESRAENIRCVEETAAGPWSDSP